MRQPLAKWSHAFSRRFRSCFYPSRMGGVGPRRGPGEGDPHFIFNFPDLANIGIYMISGLSESLYSSATTLQWIRPICATKLLLDGDKNSTNERQDFCGLINRDKTSVDGLFATRLQGQSGACGRARQDFKSPERPTPSATRVQGERGLKLRARQDFNGGAATQTGGERLKAFAQADCQPALIPASSHWSRCDKTSGALRQHFKQRSWSESG